MNSKSLESIKSKEKEEQANRMASVKTLFAIAMQNMFHKQEVKFYHEKAKEIEEHRKVINFFLEVSKNVPKYILALDYFNMMEKTVAGANSARGKRMTNAHGSFKNPSSIPRGSDPPIAQKKSIKNLLNYFGDLNGDSPPPVPNKMFLNFKQNNNAGTPTKSLFSPRTNGDQKLYNRALKD